MFGDSTVVRTEEPDTGGITTTVDLFRTVPAVDSLDMVGDSVMASTSSRYGGEMCNSVVEEGWDVEVDAETGRIVRPRRAAFFGVANANDSSTQLSADHLVLPLVEHVEGRYGDRGWTVDRHLADPATVVVRAVTVQAWGRVPGRPGRHQ